MSGRTQFGPYEIVAPLGAGGMGEVYRAHDPRLRRDVAIKILPPHKSQDGEAAARLVRESRVVASLDHPAIVTIHDVGEEDGQFYVVTELLQGDTLRERLRRGALPTAQALDYAATIASALAAAHARGVVHRDLKPENIMSTAAGAIKVLDFGVAKLVAAADAATAAPATVLTEQGATVGTPAYMAPEQLEGAAIDHRTDQFAFGVVLYEMLAGERPFKGANAAEVTASILRDEPAHLSAVRPHIPSPIARIVGRCLSKDPGERYASTTDLAHALSDARADLAVITPMSGARPGVRWMWPAAIVAVAAIAAALVAGTRNNTAPLPASEIAAPHATRAVAVLPFTTIGDTEAYLADGVTEAVTRELGHIEGTRVIASSSAFAYRGRTEGFAQIARELGVDVMVRGSVQRARDRLRISASLVNAVDDTTLWSNHYDRTVADTLAVQDDIAWQVATKLAGTLGVAAPPRPAATPTTTAAAYDAFLRGTDFLRAGVTMYGEAIAELEKAVSLDQEFALAHARLATAYTQQFFYNSSDPLLEQKASVSISKALSINPDLAEAYLARAQLMWNLRNGFPHEQAISDLRRAIANHPNLAEAHVEIGKLYYHIGLVDKAIAANEEALRLDPRSSAANERLISAKIDAGRRQETADALARSPQWRTRIRAATLSFLGRTDEAVAVIVPGGSSSDQLDKLEMNNVALLAQLFARAGRRADAERTLLVAIPLAANPTGLSDTHHAQFSIGCAYALLGHHDKAMEWISKAATEGYPSYPRFSTEPDLAALKGTPSFEALIARLQKDHERWRKSL
jgi:serine/threonine-protein kinase